MPFEPSGERPNHVLLATGSGHRIQVVRSERTVAEAGTIADESESADHHAVVLFKRQSAEKRAPVDDQQENRPGAGHSFEPPGPQEWRGGVAKRDESIPSCRMNTESAALGDVYDSSRFVLACPDAI